MLSKTQKAFGRMITAFLLTCTMHSYSAVAPPGVSFVWYGVASDSVLMDTSLPAVSLMFRITDKLRLQSYTVLNSVNTFAFSAGASAKFNVIGSWERGFHVGGGFGMGDQGKGFFTNLGAIAGAHFEVAKNILIGTDSGFRVHLAKVTDFSISANSAWLGLSIHMGL